MHTGLGDFRKIWCIDFEFQSEGALHEEGGSQHGGRPLPLCLVAVEIRSGRLLRLWRNDLYALRRAPFDIGPDSLVCTFFGSAEFGCFIALGWSMPFNVIDLYVEHRLRMNGVSKVKGLVDVLQLNGLPHISAAVKDAHRDKILTQTQWTDIEQKQILDYCQSDVLGVVDLLEHLANWLDFPRVLLRGRYIAAIARMEWNGVPIDVAYWNRLKAAREPVLTRLVSDVDKQYGVYDGLKFREQWFSRMLARRGIPWKRTPIDGRPVLEKEYFKEQARFYGLDDLYALRETVTHLREPVLAIGPD
jgi:DNA polymerase-1